jgi:hypothetical protein
MVTAERSPLVAEGLPLFAVHIGWEARQNPFGQASFSDGVAPCSIAGPEAHRIHASQESELSECLIVSIKMSFTFVDRTNDFWATDSRTYLLYSWDYCHRSKSNQPQMVEMTQPVNSTHSAEKREAFFFRTSPISTSYNGLVWKKNADLRRLWWLGHFDHCWPGRSDR